MQTFTGEAVGHGDEELHPRAKAAQERLNSPLGCAGFLMVGIFGMVASCAAFIGILNALRIASR